MRLIDADKLRNYIYYGENDHAVFGTYDKAVIDLIDRQPTVTVEDIRREVGNELLSVIKEKQYGTEKHNLWLISQIKHICFGEKRICDIIAENWQK